MRNGRTTSTAGLASISAYVSGAGGVAAIDAAKGSNMPRTKPALCRAVEHVVGEVRSRAHGSVDVVLCCRSAQEGMRGSKTCELSRVSRLDERRVRAIVGCERGLVVVAVRDHQSPRLSLCDARAHGAVLCEQRGIGRIERTQIVEEARLLSPKTEIVIATPEITNASERRSLMLRQSTSLRSASHRCSRVGATFSGTNGGTSQRVASSDPSTPSPAKSASSRIPGNDVHARPSKPAIVVVAPSAMPGQSFFIVSSALPSGCSTWWFT